MAVRLNENAEVVKSVKEGLKPVLPDHMVFDGIRYGLMAFTTLGLYPWIFKKLKF